PIGIAPGNRTLVKSTSAVTGDFISLGNNTSIRSLVIEDCPGRSGNVIAVLSRSAGDTIAASIDRCEILNPNPISVSPQGPRGRAVLLVSRNLNLGADPSPHDNASLSLTMTRSLIRSPSGGTGVFAVNFASRSCIDVRLDSNVIGGGLDVTAAASRP